MIPINRYVVLPWTLEEERRYTVWDTYFNRLAGTPIWMSEVFAQEDADKLNGSAEGGGQGDGRTTQRDG